MSVRDSGAGKRGQLWHHLRTAARLVLRRPLASVTVVPLRDDGRIVMVRRVDVDRWVLPGGFLDWGETLAEAGARETEEETGLQVVRIGRLIGVYSAPERDPRAHCITVLMEAQVRGEPRVGDPLEVREIRAFSPSELPFAEMVLGSDTMVRDYLAGRTVLA